MLGFVVGTVCLIGLIKLVKGRRRWHHGYGRGGSCGYRGDDCDDYGRSDYGRSDCGPGWGGGWRGHRGGPFGRGGFDRGFGGYDRDDDAGPGGPVLLRGLFERLGTTPGQERVIAASLKELRAAFKKAAEEKAKGAKAVAEALKGDDFKTESMGDAFAHLDTGNEAIRDATFNALAKIHEALDERQRKILADLVGRGGRALENLAEQA